MRASARPHGQGGEEPAAGRRLTLGGPVLVLAVLPDPRSSTPPARAQTGSRYTGAHTVLHTHPDSSPSATSVLPPSPAPRTLLTCFSAYPLIASPPTPHSCQALGLSLAHCPHLARLGLSSVWPCPSLVPSGWKYEQAAAPLGFLLFLGIPNTFWLQISSLSCCSLGEPLLFDPVSNIS